MSDTINRSAFVTVLAWIFIVLSGFGTMISLLQNIMVQIMFNAPEMEKSLQTLPPGAPPFVAFMISHFQLFFFATFVLTAVTLVASIGLLKRRNWARLYFVAFMILGIVWNFGSLALQFTMLSSMQSSFPSVPNAPDMKPFMMVMAAMSVLLALGFSALFGWIAKRLLAPAVAAEFGR